MDFKKFEKIVDEFVDCKTCEHYDEHSKPFVFCTLDYTLYTCYQMKKISTQKLYELLYENLK